MLAAGGDLSSDRLLAAYHSGIFPWYDDGQPILWWSPDPRCILRPSNLHASRRLKQYAKRSMLEVRFNRAFQDVIRACARRRPSEQGTWITAEMNTAYQRLHEEGWAHSIEVWDANSLVGGLYGVGIGQVFFGESMFSSNDNASKFALLGLTRTMQKEGNNLIDCQVVSQHLISLGATTMPRHEFVDELRASCSPATRMRNWPDESLPVAQLLRE